ncbi:MAG: hypothetical protein KC645_18390, partial [Gemmatimonadetes bacterium]|nr:hypothetical protein [Gemmatimonadota bacterium]
MRRRSLPLCVLLLSACGGSTDARFAPPDPTRIERSHVERVLSVLASDSLRGRQAFTDDALRAADYLAGEFEAAGLEPMAGTGYLQRFPVRSRTAREIRVTLDGRARTEQEVVARAGASSVRWSTGDVPVLRISASDDMQTALGRIRAVDGDALVLVPAANGELFATLSGFYGRPVRTLEATDGPTTVLALWEGDGEPTFDVALDAEEAADTLVNVVGVVP